jgi:hypothetical protein
MTAAARIGATRVRVTNVRGEEFEEAIGRALAAGGDEGRGLPGREGGEEPDHIAPYPIHLRGKSP